MWVQYNPNPTTGRRIGDCAVRAVSKALDTTWEKAFLLLCVNAFNMGDLPNSNNVIASVLRQHGFKRLPLPTDCPDCYTYEEFLEKNPKGTFVLFSDNHVATAVDGILFDSWDSSECPIMYVWYKDKEPQF